MTHLITKRRVSALERQCKRLQDRLSLLRKWGYRLTWIRLLIFTGGFVLSSILFFWEGPLWGGIGIVLWLVAFAIAVAAHRRVESNVSRFQIWLEGKQKNLARLALDWDQLASTPLPAAPAGHPFAGDLDLLGRRSLHNLIDTAATYDGSRRLQEWLLDSDPRLESILKRQRLARELAPRVTFRNRLRLQALLSAEGADRLWSAARLHRWLAAPSPAGGQRRLLAILLGLAAINLLFFIGHQAGWLPAWWPFTLTLYAVLYLGLGRAASSLFEEALALQSALGQTAGVFQFLEEYGYGEAPNLRALCTPFQDAQRPSRQLRRIGRIVNAAGLSRNPILWLALNAFFPWDLFFAFRLHDLRTAIAERLPNWLDIWFDLEALNSLANLKYINPHYTFPTIDTRGNGAPPFAADGIGHPLILERSLVRNDFNIPALGRVDLITGSNMAGKSSFLRSLGTNLVLAYAGGPVSAARLETQLFRLFTSIRVTDDVTNGISYFYAEVRRLRALLTALHAGDQRPLFFLVDEIFRGTNNRERLIGSRAYVKALTGGSGVGVIATHDLDLVQLADQLPEVRNFHFRDAIEDGKMTFDYLLHPGPCPTTNALKIMAQAGLPIEGI